MIAFQVNIIFLIDVNECDLPDAPCQFGGSCINMVGTFRCLCNPGFITDADGRECVGKQFKSTCL